MGAILFGIGIFLMVSGFGSGSSMTGVVGIVVTVVGALLFWRTSATKAYLDSHKKRQ